MREEWWIEQRDGKWWLVEYLNGHSMQTVTRSATRYEIALWNRSVLAEQRLAEKSGDASSSSAPEPPAGVTPRVLELAKIGARVLHAETEDEIAAHSGPFRKCSHFDCRLVRESVASVLAENTEQP